MPPGIDIAAWRDAVDQTRAMLLTVTASNLLDVPDMVELRVELGPTRSSRMPQPARPSANWQRSGTKSPTEANSC